MANQYPTLVQLAGRRFGRLVVLSETSRRGRYVRRWRCRCDCGNEHTVAMNNLTSGEVTSCGCLARENTIVRETIHNESHPPTPEYRAWLAMKQRCANPKARGFQYWGGRGFRVSAVLVNDYLRFLEEVGRKPHPSLTLDRINNDRGYEPGNLRWATRTEQRLNQRRQKPK